MGTKKTKKPVSKKKSITAAKKKQPCSENTGAHGVPIREPIHSTSSHEHKKKPPKKNIGRRYAATIQATLDGFWICDTSGRLIDVNDVICKMLGYSRHELLEMSVSDIEVVEDAAEVNKHIKKISEKGYDRFQTQYKCKDVTIIDVEVTVNYVDADGGQFFVVIRDITEEKRFAERLKLHETRLQGLLDLHEMVEASQQEILNFVREEVLDITQSELAFIGFLDSNEWEMTISNWSRETMSQCAVSDYPIHFPITRAGWWAQAVRQRKPLIVNDYSVSDSHKKGCPEGHVPIYRFLCVPVFDKDRIVAVTGVANKKKDYDQDDIFALTSMMNDMWKLINRKRTEEDLQQYRHHLENLVEARTAEIAEANRKLLQEIEERKQLEEMILGISEREQKRIGQELHDSLGQQLTGIAFTAKVLEKKLASRSIKEAADVTEIMNLVKQAMEQTRGLAKGLHPVDLDGGSLVMSLRELAATTEKLFSTNCVLKCDKPISIQDSVVATHLYRITQEAITNAIKHGKAKNIRIELANAGNKSILMIKSDGLDFPKDVDIRGDGMGLQVMDHRADIIGGYLNVHAGTGGGTVVVCAFPNENKNKQ